MHTLCQTGREIRRECENIAKHGENRVFQGSTVNGLRSMRLDTGAFCPSAPVARAQGWSESLHPAWGDLLHRAIRPPHESGGCLSARGALNDWAAATIARRTPGTAARSDGPWTKPAMAFAHWDDPQKSRGFSGSPAAASCGGRRFPKSVGAGTGPSALPNRPRAGFSLRFPAAQRAVSRMRRTSSGDTPPTRSTAPIRCGRTNRS